MLSTILHSGYHDFFEDFDGARQTFVKRLLSYFVYERDLSGKLVSEEFLRGITLVEGLSEAPAMR